MVTPRKLAISFKGATMKHHTKDQGDLGVLKAQVDPATFNKLISLRVETPKNNQVQNVKFAHDYREVP